MLPALLAVFAPTAGAADLAILVRSPEGDFGSVTMTLEAGTTPPAKLPVRLNPPSDARRKKAAYTAEAGLEPMGPTMGVTVRVFRGEAEKREMVLDAAMFVAPSGVAGYRTAVEGGEWVVDVTYKDPLADEMIFAPVEEAAPPSR
jgi:hypothetical protein